jgi:hypothetical protein
MSTWAAPALATLQDTFSLHLSAGPAGPDTPEVELGMVLVDRTLYVRPQRGRTSQWYRAAISKGEGRIRVADQTFAVRFEPAGPGTEPEVDAAYRSKYGGFAAFAVSPPSRAATVRISPA